jgi:hypothetical protein
MKENWQNSAKAKEIVCYIPEKQRKAGLSRPVWHISFTGCCVILYQNILSSNCLWFIWIQQHWPDLTNCNNWIIFSDIHSLHDLKTTTILLWLKTIWKVFNEKIQLIRNNYFIQICYSYVILKTIRNLKIYA